MLPCLSIELADLSAIAVYTRTNLPLTRTIGIFYNLKTSK